MKLSQPATSSDLEVARGIARRLAGFPAAAPAAGGGLTFMPAAPAVPAEQPAEDVTAPAGSVAEEPAIAEPAPEPEPTFQAEAPLPEPEPEHARAEEEPAPEPEAPEPTPFAPEAETPAGSLEPELPVAGPAEPEFGPAPEPYVPEPEPYVPEPEPYVPEPEPYVPEPEPYVPEPAAALTEEPAPEPAEMPVASPDDLVSRLTEEPAPMPAADEPFDPGLPVDVPPPATDDLVDSLVSEPPPPPPPPPTWDEVLGTCRGLAGARGAMLIRPAGDVLASDGDWPADVQVIAGRLMPVLEKAYKTSSAPLSIKLGASVLSAWRVTVDGTALTVGFVSDAPLSPDVHSLVDEEVRKGRL